MDFDAFEGECLKAICLPLFDDYHLLMMQETTERRACMLNLKQELGGHAALYNPCE